MWFCKQNHRGDVGIAPYKHIFKQRFMGQLGDILYLVSCISYLVSYISYLILGGVYFACHCYPCQVRFRDH